MKRRPTMVRSYRWKTVIRRKIRNCPANWSHQIADQCKKLYVTRSLHEEGRSGEGERRGRGGGPLGREDQGQEGAGGEEKGSKREGGDGDSEGNGKRWQLWRRAGKWRWQCLRLAWRHSRWEAGV